MSEADESAAPNPTLRPATRADKAALQRFRCWTDGEPSFIRSVQTTIRVGGWKATAAQRAVVIEFTGRIVASARHAHEVSVDGLGVRWVEWIALSVDWHGQTLPDGRRVSDVVWQLVLADCTVSAAAHHEVVIACRIHRDNIRSQRVSERIGWVRSSSHVTPDPADYETWFRAVPTT